jgi:type IV pilus assembly protein PilY1
MKHTNLLFSMAILASSLAAGISVTSLARAGTPTSTSNDDFTQANDTNSWQTFDGACLTAGDGTGSIPSCKGLPYYGGQVQIGGANGFLGNASSPSSGYTQTPDPAGQGALRFTNWYGQAGSIISSGAPFPTGTGIQVVFKTVTYDGDRGGAGGDGADGMAFFLMDGSLPPYDTGAFGGSLGYTCANNNNDNTLRSDGTVRGYDGLIGGYIGLGIDEYGNFLNPGDNTATGPGYQPGRIGVRGAGSIAFGWLNKNFPLLYPTSLLTTPDGGTVTAARRAVHDTCRTGYLWDYSNPGAPVQTLIPVADYAPVGAPVILNSILPGQLIAAEGATTRSAANPITYSLKITQNGILSLALSYNGGNYQPVITKQDITASNGPLPTSFRFGFTGSTGGSRNVHEILCFQAAPAVVAGTSVGVNEQEAAKIASGTQAYLAIYYPGDNTGRLTANNLTYDPINQVIAVSATANWDASCNLTGIPVGGTCASTGVIGPLAPQTGWNNRTMLSYDGISTGVPFRWIGDVGVTAITVPEENTLDLGDTTSAPPLYAGPNNNLRLHYLRGERANEINTLGVGLFRARDGVLGDIVDSSPTWVGPPTTHYSALWNDRLVPADPTPENTGTQTFAQFITAEQSRLNVVYAGANDGFLHGFESGSFDSSGNYVNNAATPNDGAEVLAYMPGAVLNTIHNAVDGTLDYSGPQYSHNFYVDATPESDDLFYNGTWHTWLVGGLGQGGPAIYALDVTDPQDPSGQHNFAEANAANIVMGEWSSTSIACQNDSTAPVPCKNNLGNTYGTPIIRRLHDGKWAIIFGNGFASASGDAGIFVMLLDASGHTQAANTYYLSTGKAGTSDGIAYVSSADLDGDHITDYVYAGDLLGNIWRFDLTSATEGNWAASATPLFTAPAGQPITTKVQVISVPQGSGPARIMIDFGTGQKFPPTNLNPAYYQSGVQYLYGFWDWNLANWNSLSGTKYLSLPSGATPAPAGALTPANLQSQTLTQIGSTATNNAALTITSNPVCWNASSTCGSGNNQYGFAVALPGTQEQLVFNPLIYQNALIVNTTIPAANSPSSCTVLHDTGDTIAISLSTGGSLGFFLNATSTNVAGSQTNGTGTPFMVTAGGSTFMITQSLGDGSFTAPPGSPPAPGAILACTSNGTSSTCGGPTKTLTLSSKRLTWIQRR